MSTNAKNITLIKYINLFPGAGTHLRNQQKLEVVSDLTHAGNNKTNTCIPVAHSLVLLHEVQKVKSIKSNYFTS